MAIAVRVGGPTGQVEPLGRGRFRVGVRDRRAVLPGLEITAAGGQPVPQLLRCEPEVVSAPPGLDLTEALRVWRGALPHPVVLDGPVRVPDVAVPLPGPSEGDVVITWLGAYRVGSSPPEEFDMTTSLHFTADDTTAGAQSPHREVLGTRPHPGFLAIDFGTSNCTAVLYDQEYLTTRALDPGQVDRLRTALLHLLTAATPPPGTEDQMAALRQRLTREVPSADGADPVAAIRTVLANDEASTLEPDRRTVSEPEATYRVLLALERAVDDVIDPLRRWLRSALHRAYDAAFDEPRLESLLLFPVELDPQSGSRELRSRVDVPESGSLHDVTMPVDDSAPAAGAQPFAGLKAHIADPPTTRLGETLGRPGFTVGELIGAALRHLVERSDAFVADNPKRFAQGPTTRVVATYPTIAPPLARQSLRDLLAGPEGPGADQVITAYDEAVAAAMFFLMREFGGELEIGIEAAKSRYQQVAAKDREWKQNVLVIDIGGGTTDIALLTMKLADTTPADVARHPWSGRYYTVTPRVRGSTGHLQNGGEYLTLLVFRWLKAEIADQLLTRAPDQYRNVLQSLPESFRDETGYVVRSLVDRVLSGRDAARVLDIVDTVVPTRWASAPEHEQAFYLLWSVADRAKRALGAEQREGGHSRSFPVEGTSIRQIVNAVTSAQGEDAAGVGAVVGDVHLDQERFRALVMPPLEDVMGRATELVMEAFVDPQERLDRIILTGKTSAMRHVREALTTRFGRRAGDERTVRWEPSGIEVMHDYAKLATAVGAAWAQSVTWYRRSPEGAGALLREGKTHLDILIENLFFNLPCTFFEQSQNQQRLDRFGVGEELVQLDDEPVGKARRATWDELTPNLDVRRHLSPGKSLRWASFNFTDQAREEGFTPTPGIWPEEVQTKLEVDQGLEMSLLLRRGKEEHHVVAGPWLDVAGALRDVFGEEALRPDGTLPDVLPGDVLVDSLIAGSTSRGNSVVFPAEEVLVFDRTFFDTDEDTEGRPGLVTTRGFEAADERGNADWWTFTLRHPSGAEKNLGTLPRPVLGDGQMSTRYVVTLDDRGALRVHAGELPYRAARSMREVEDRPGRVLLVKLPSAPPEYDEDRDPFTGKH